MTKGRCTKCWSALIPAPEDGTTNSCCLAAHHLKIHLQASTSSPTRAETLAKTLLCPPVWLHLSSGKYCVILSVSKRGGKRSCWWMGGSL